MDKFFIFNKNLLMRVENKIWFYSDITKEEFKANKAEYWNSGYETPPDISLLPRPSEIFKFDEAGVSKPVVVEQIVPEAGKYAVSINGVVKLQGEFGADGVLNIDYASLLDLGTNKVVLTVSDMTEDFSQDFSYTMYKEDRTTLVYHRQYKIEETATIDDKLAYVDGGGLYNLTLEGTVGEAIQEIPTDGKTTIKSITVDCSQPTVNIRTREILPVANNNIFTYEVDIKGELTEITII